MADVIFIAIAAIAAVVLWLMLRNWHRQRDIESSDHVVPEDYD